MPSSLHTLGRRTARRSAALVVVGLLVPTLAGPTVAASPRDLPRAATAAADGRGTWEVQAVGDGRYEVSWTSPVALPMSSDRPTITFAAADGVGVASLSADGRTVSALVAADSAPDPAFLDVVLSGDRLDETGRDPITGSVAPLSEAPVTTTVDDPALPGPHAIVSSAYELEPQPIEGFDEPVEVVGHVVEPAPEAVTGPRPLVLFLHGRHSVCYVPDDDDGFGEGDWPCAPPEEEIPSHLGYRYVQRTLASQGYATVSIRVNGINAQDFQHEDGGADARAVLVQRHLDHWVDLAAAHQVDLSRTVLVGHSRGGEGVNRASIRIPLSAPYRIVGQVLIAPTNFGNQAAPYVPTVTLLPYCDGDVIDLQGQRFTDVGRDVALDDPALKSSVMVMGANHNFFNTEWTPGIAQAPSWDDWFGGKDEACGKATPTRLSAKEQRAVGRAYIAGAVAMFAKDAQEFLPMYDGTPAVPASVGDADIRSHAIGGGRALRRPALDTSLTLPEGADTQFCLGRTAGSPDSCGRTARSSSQTPHWPAGYEVVPLRREFEMTWTAPGQVGGMNFDKNLDLTGNRLELRTIVDPGFGDVELAVRLTDADGASAELTPEGGGVLQELLEGPFELSKRWAQPLLVDPTGAGIDLSRVAKVELIGDSADGRVWVLDVASAPAALAAVPDKRVPVIDISDDEVDEGTGGRVTGRVPFTITGELTKPAKFTVVTTGQSPGSRERFTVDLAPGQTSGGIPIEYVADDRDDFSRMKYYVSGYVGRNVMMDRYLGGLTILDDDPEPIITVRPLEKTVAEGDLATFEVKMSARADYDLFFRGKVAAGPAPVVLTGDVGATWVKRHVFGKGNATTPLHKRNTYIFEEVRAGTRTTWVSIPIAEDGLAEPRESLTVRFRIQGVTYLRTIWIARS